MYSIFFNFLRKIIKKHTLFKYGFNLSPMYRRSTGRVYYASENLLNVKIKIPLTYKNRNFVGSLFGGSLSSATDPIYMIQLIQILGEDYVVWDKATTIKFKQPARETAYASFDFTEKEIAQLKTRVAADKEIDLIKQLVITNKDGSVVFAELIKTIYIADKEYYKEKRRAKKSKG